MSKNIDEIVDGVIPKPCLDWNTTSISERVFCRDSLKQALTEKKLIRPLSENEILDIVCDGMTHYRGNKGIAKAIYERQFKESV